MGWAGAIEAAEKGKVSEKIGKPLTAAMDAAKNKQLDTALAKVKEAEVVEKKTPFEQFKINETLAYIYTLQKKYAETAVTYEKILATPQFLTPEQAQAYPRTVIQMYAAAQQYPKVIETAKPWLQSKPNDTDILTLLGQAYYSTKDHKLCYQTFSAAAAAAEKAGNKPNESWLDYVRTCAGAIDDDNAETQAYEKLARYYPKPDYWRPYLDRLSRGRHSDLAEFNWGRLKHDTGAMKNADEYTIFAQLAIVQYGAPGEAVKVLEDGFNKKILGVDKTSAARQQNTLVRAKEAAQADKTRMAQLSGAADQDATGQASVDLGTIHFGNGQYDQAITFLEKGIKKGGVKELANTKLILGIAQLRKGEKEAARATFKSVSSDQDLGKVAAAWMIRSYN